MTKLSQLITTPVDRSPNERLLTAMNGRQEFQSEDIYVGRGRSHRSYMRILVTGSTTWKDYLALRREFARLPGPCTVVVGDCPGADACARHVATELDWPLEAMKKNRADERKHPGMSWKGLNERMLASGIDLVLAFHADLDKPNCARGTRHVMDLASLAGIPTLAFTS